MGAEPSAPLMKLLFGKKHASVVARFQRATWRGAYLREVDYFRRSEDEALEEELLNLFLASPASARISELTFGDGEPTRHMKRAVLRLSDRPIAKALRSLVLATQTEYTGRGDFDLEHIARLPVLQHLSISPRLKRPAFQRQLAERLVTLSVAPFDAAAVRELFPRGGYRSLRDLTLDITSAQQEPVLSGRATPHLEILRIRGSADHEALVDALSTSALLPRLHELHLEPSQHEWQLGVRCSPAKLGPAFAHLTCVVVRKGSSWTEADEPTDP